MQARSIGTSLWRLPLIVIAAWVVAASSALSARAQAEATLPCPAPTALYALRHNSKSEFTKLLNLPRPRPVSKEDESENGVSSRAWQTSLHRVWPPAAGHCHVAVVEARLSEQGRTEDGDFDSSVEHFGATFELERSTGTLVRGPDLAPHDWMMSGDPAVGDSDGDQRIDAIGERTDPALGWCGYGMLGDECHCTIPGRMFALVSTPTGLVRVPAGGGVLDDAALTKANALLANPSDDFTCPKERVPYRRWDVQGRLFVRALADGAELHFLAEERACSGWEEWDGEDAARLCRAPKLVVVHQQVRNGKVGTPEQTAGARTEIRPSDPKAQVYVMPWPLYDGVGEPHVVATTFSARERKRHQRANGRPARVDPGTYLVLLKRGKTETVYQVVARPGIAIIVLDLLVEVES